MGLGPHDGSREEEVPRPPQFSDLTRICRELNRLGVRYVVIGGFAIIHHGFPRLTYDIDLLNRDFLRELLTSQGMDVTPASPVEDPVTRWLKRLQAWWQRRRKA
jgi:hypothetical protein